MKFQKKQIQVLFNIALLLTVVVCLGVTTAQAQEVVRWPHIIGIIQAGNTVGSGAGQVAGGGQPWSAVGGRARVNLDNGHIEFRVRGLVLAGGNSIGTRGGNTQVKGTLVCDTNGSAGAGDSTLVDTALVDFSLQGNAHFEGNVALPAACINEPDIAFLIRLPSGAWIANGAVREP